MSTCALLSTIFQCGKRVLQGFLTRAADCTKQSPYHGMNLALRHQTAVDDLCPGFLWTTAHRGENSASIALTRHGWFPSIFGLPLGHLSPKLSSQRHNVSPRTIADLLTLSRPYFSLAVGRLSSLLHQILSLCRHHRANLHKPCPARGHGQPS